jgi:hypothetical protein
VGIQDRPTELAHATRVGCQGSKGWPLFPVCRLFDSSHCDPTKVAPKPNQTNPVVTVTTTYTYRYSYVMNDPLNLIDPHPGLPIPPSR